jgi:CBS domain containing-hemolysin-like protein
LEPPSSPFEQTEIELWISLLSTILLAAVLFALAAVSGAVAVENSHKNRPEESKIAAFAAAGLRVRETLSFIYFIILIAAVMAFACFATFGEANFLCLFPPAMLFFSLFTLFFKHIGARFPQRTMFFFGFFIRFANFLFTPLVNRVYCTVNQADEANADTPAANTALQKTSDIEVKEIISSRMDVAAVDIATGLPDLLAFIVESGYSRFPVYEHNIDHVKGILHVKDLLPFMLDRQADFDWRTIVRRAHFVSEYNKINVLLEEMKHSKAHIAIVVDEYGTTTGIVTLEDILEEIVGDIFDESDVESDEKFFVRHKDGSYSFKGQTLLMDFCRVMTVDHEIFDSTKGDSETLAGLLLEHKGDFLVVGETIDFAGFIFTVESADDRRIKRINVIKKQTE